MKTRLLLVLGSSPESGEEEKKSTDWGAGLRALVRQVQKPEFKSQTLV